MTNPVAAAIDAGINLIDTAPVYGRESVVGVAIAGRRDDVILSTKIQTKSTCLGNLIDEAEASANASCCPLVRLLAAPRTLAEA